MFRQMWMIVGVRALFVPRMILGAILTGMLWLSGCATDVAKLERFSSLYYQDSALKAHKFAKKHAKGDDLLWLIQAGVSGFHAQSPAALELLDSSEKQLMKFEEDGILASALAQTGAALVNDNVMDYRGNLYEGVFVNYYKALLYLSSADSASARVELNRANDRQRRAKDYYAKQIAKAMEQEQDRFSKSKANGLVNRDSKNIDSILQQQYSNLAAFHAFEHFINPSISYLSGLIFALQGDGKGLDYLKEAYGISRSNIIAQDLAYFLRPDSRAFTWILLEEGRQVRKSEASFELPLMTTQGFYHFGIALPQLESVPQPMNGYALDSAKSLDSPESKNTSSKLESRVDSGFEVITHTDGIIATEFEKQLQAIATRALVSASIKLAMQIALQQGLGQVHSGLGLLGSLAGSIYSLASTSADLRITSVLPRRILLARIAHTSARDVEILAVPSVSSGGRAIASVRIEPCEAESAEHTLESSKAKKRTKTSPNDSAQNLAKSPALTPIHTCLGQHSIIYIRDTPAHAYSKVIFQAPAK